MYHVNIGSLKTIAKEMASSIKNFDRCQKSVSHTRKVDEPKNFGPLEESPFFHLSLHDKLGLSQV